MGKAWRNFIKIRGYILYSKVIEVVDQYKGLPERLNVQEQ